jgi:hypothetical protein
MKISGCQRIIKKNVTTELNAFPLDTFDACFLQLLVRCKICAAVKRVHLEGE